MLRPANESTWLENKIDKVLTGVFRTYASRIIVIAVNWKYGDWYVEIRVFIVNDFSVLNRALKFSDGEADALYFKTYRKIDGLIADYLNMNRRVTEAIFAHDFHRSVQRSTRGLVVMKQIAT